MLLFSLSERCCSGGHCVSFDSLGIGALSLARSVRGALFLTYAAAAAAAVLLLWGNFTSGEVVALDLTADCFLGAPLLQ